MAAQKALGRLGHELVRFRDQVYGPEVPSAAFSLALFFRRFFLRRRWRSSSRFRSIFLCLPIKRDTPPYALLEVHHLLAKGRN
jgi:hypothetical protein